ncbi:HPr kinase/phosphatase C-terminal domain-containing protein [Iodidimonas sp. SYSU 1G8]|uniref:HPr kinase/phosphorylase n=1 Tax=Iodidimonas sp. SYSU 1G8 TaxID=3133967 RepID=UPI0031FE62DF
MSTVHATCVSIDGIGVLLRAPSGGGKSDLALRLIDEGAALVSDDYTHIEIQDGRVLASAPSTIRGMMEVRGLGLVRLPCSSDSAVGLIVDLVEPSAIERMPEPETALIDGAGAIRLPVIRVAPFEVSAAAKIRLAVRRCRESGS